MQTFLPKATVDFDEVAKLLDNKRLNKQALEGWQILMTLLELDPQGKHRKPKGWVNHPAVKMWRDYEPMLFTYIMAMVKEWKSRGYNSTIGDKASATIDRAWELGLLGTVSAVPDWMQDPAMYEAIASSHRKALLAKHYEWYSQFGWAEDAGTAPESYEYVWTTKQEGESK
jgi:hypothetical protein